MRTHDEAFLADMVEHPDDDAPRLVYADWLDDRGEADRAEFIRLQIEQARLPADSPRGAALARREGELRGSGEAAWRDSLPRLEGVTWEEFRRGFVESVFVATVETFLAHAEAIFAAAPVRSVQVGMVADADAARLAGSPHLARLRELNLGNNPAVGPVGVRALALSPHLAGLQALLLHYNAMGDAAVAELAASPHLGALEELYLSGNLLGDPAVIALANSPRLPRLRELDLRDNGIADPGILALTSRSAHEQLTTLYLVNNHIGPLGAHALAGAEHLPRLARLYLNYNPVGNEGALAFAESNRRGALLDLDLRHCGIRDAGGLALARSLYLQGVQMLWLGGNRLHRETIELLRGRFGAHLRL